SGRLGSCGVEGPLRQIQLQGRRQGRRTQDQLGRQQGRNRHDYGEDPVAMRVRVFFQFVLAVVALHALPSHAADAPDPAADARAFQNYFTTKFPKLKLEDFVNGPYSMNEDMRKQWEEKEQFPPYEFALEAGKEMFATPFKNGKTYADCFPNGGIGVRQNYPY